MLLKVSRMSKVDVK